MRYVFALLLCLSALGADQTPPSINTPQTLDTVLAGNGAGVQNSFRTLSTASITSGTLAVARGGTNLGSGTSGGVLAFTGTGTIASSGLLAANAIVIGGGTGVAPSTTTTGTGVLTALGINTGSAGAFVTFNGAGGTPSSLTLTNATGLPVAGITASTSTALGVGSIELGAASDTTIARSGAGAITVEGVQVLLSGAALGTPSSGTLTNCTGYSATNLASGTIPALRFPPGTICQALTNTLTVGASVHTTSSTFQASGLTVTITPKFSNSILKIEFCTNIKVPIAVAGSMQYSTFRDSTQLDSAGGYTQGIIASNGNALISIPISPFCFDPAPGAGPYTYTIKFKSTDNATDVIFLDYGVSSYKAFMIVTEIAQ